MDSKKKLMMSVVIGAVSLLLVLLIIIGVLLLPSSTTVPPVTENKPAVTTPVEVQKYDVTGRIFDKNGNAMANAKFCISLGPTDFITDDNGFFILKNLPVGTYTIFAYDKDGNRIGGTQITLSSDGAVTINYYTFEKGEVVTLCFDGEKFFAVEVIENTSGGTSVAPPKEEDDEMYTNLSWMKDLAPGYGGYGITPYRDPEMFLEVVGGEEYDMFNTYFLAGNLEYCKYSAKRLAEEGKQMWLSILDTSMLSASNPENPKDKLVGNWRDLLDEYMHEIYAIAGPLFCGFYFDEPNLHITDTDFTRVTEYIRKTYNRRVFVVHNAVAFTTPAGKGMDLIGYKPGRNDGLIVSKANHKWVTDVAYWRYASLRRYGGFKSSTREWKKAVSLFNENARLWFVPPIGTYDWKTLETETAEMIYEMYKYHIQFENFGGIMLYSMTYGPLSGGPSFVQDGDKSGLTDEDFLKDENGNYVYGDDGKRIVSFSVNYSPIPLVGTNAYAEGGGYYFNFEKQSDGSYRWPIVREYIHILGEGLQSEFRGEKTHEDILKELEAVYTPDRSLYLASNRWWE